MAACVSVTRDEYLRDLRASSDGAKNLVATHSPAQLKWREAEGVWSITDCLDHLAVTNRTYLAALREACAGKSQSGAAAVGPLSPSGWFSNYFIRNMGPPVKLKIKTKRNAMPVSANDPDKAIDAFLASNDELACFVAETARVDLRSIRFRNPFVGVLRFSVATGLLVLLAHERRHIWQADQIRTNSGFPESKMGMAR